jgi:hypothetical protein
MDGELIVIGQTLYLFQYGNVGHIIIIVINNGLASS